LPHEGATGKSEDSIAETETPVTPQPAAGKLDKPRGHHPLSGVASIPLTPRILPTPLVIHRHEPTRATPYEVLNVTSTPLLVPLEFVAEIR